MFSIRLPFTLIILLISSSAHSKQAKAPLQFCPAGEHWVRSHIQSPYTRANGVSVSGSIHKSHCQKNPPAYAIWNDRLKSTFPPGWQFKKENSKGWTDEEKEEVLNALSILPEALLVKTVEGIYRMKTFLQNPVNPAANHEQQIVLYDKAFGKNQNLARMDLQKIR